MSVDLARLRELAVRYADTCEKDNDADIASRYAADRVHAYVEYRAALETVRFRFVIAMCDVVDAAKDLFALGLHSDAKAQAAVTKLEAALSALEQTNAT